MMACTTPVLVVVAGPTGMIAALTLARNNVPVHIIEKELQHQCRQHGPSIQPRTFEVFHFLHVPKIHGHATPFLPLQEHNRGSLKPRNTFPIVEYTEPTLAIPYMGTYFYDPYNAKFMGQPTLEAILHNHLVKLGCTIELDEKCVRAKVVKHHGDDREEFVEDIEVAYLIGANGTKGMTRKQLGLTFLGATQEHDFILLGDIHLEAKGLDQDAATGRISFRPTDKLGSDGWQFGLSSRTTDLKGLIHDREALVNCIRDFIGIGDGVKVKEVMWVSEFRSISFVVSSCFPPSSDAAHLCNLAWKIALVYKGFSLASLLGTYTVEQLPMITEMLGYTTEMHNVMFDELGANHTLPLTADNNNNSKNVESNLERGMHCGKNMYMLGVNYHTSPIIIDDLGVPAIQNAYGEIQEGILRASDHAPDAPGLVPILPSSCTLSNVLTGSQSNGMAADIHMFDLFTSMHHTVIIFMPTLVVPFVQSVLRTLQQVVPKELVRRVVVLPCSPSELDGHVESWTSSEEGQVIDVEVLIDQVGHAYRGYIVEKHKTKVVVIRPDGVVDAPMKLSVTERRARKEKVEVLISPITSQLRLQTQGVPIAGDMVEFWFSCWLNNILDLRKSDCEWGYLLAGVEGQQPVMKGHLYSNVDVVNSAWQLELQTLQPSTRHFSIINHNYYAFVSELEISSSFTTSLQSSQTSDTEVPVPIHSSLTSSAKEQLRYQKTVNFASGKGPVCHWPPSVVGPVPQELSPSAPIPMLYNCDLEAEYNMDPTSLVLLNFFDIRKDREEAFI
ncbi:hypothetical protein EDC04DRAFT_3096085 [Pisolithus marmoratus]|nr:hypothetical protein EDC04DRAFT_3096085 [Pisolithus marmoratus]